MDKYDSNGVRIYSAKVFAIVETEVPKNTTALHIFLDLAVYYRSYIWNFESISATFHASSSKKILFEWNEEMQSEFLTLKEKLSTVLVLSYTDFNGPFIVETGASGKEVGAVLVQKRTTDTSI